MTKHLSGPWEIDYEHPDSLTSISIIGPGGIAICHIAHSGDMNHERNEANARLMRASPELLEALQAGLRVADRATAEFDLARAAIQSATGVLK